MAREAVYALIVQNPDKVLDHVKAPELIREMRLEEQPDPEDFGPLSF